MFRSRHLATVAALAAPLALATTAHAETRVVSVDVGQPQAEIATTLTVRTVADESTSLYGTYRPTGGPGCAPTSRSDPGRSLAIDGRRVSSGDTTESAVQTFAEAGTYQLCFWLARSSSALPIATFSTTVTVARPSGSIQITPPGQAVEDESFLVTFSGVSGVSRGLWMSLRPAGGPACGAGPSADPGSDQRVASVLGEYRREVRLQARTPGNWRVCAWLATSRSDIAPIAVAEQIFPVIAPTRPTRATLVLGSARRVGERLLLTARISSSGGRPSGVCVFERGRARGWAVVGRSSYRNRSSCSARLRLTRPGATAFRVRFVPDTGWAPSKATSRRIVIRPAR